MKQKAPRCPHMARRRRSLRYNSRMRAVISPDGGTYPYAGMGYANPDAVTSMGNGLSTTTYTYDNNGNLTSSGNGTATTTYTYDGNTQSQRY